MTQSYSMSWYAYEVLIFQERLIKIYVELITVINAATRDGLIELA